LKLLHFTISLFLLVGTSFSQLPVSPIQAVLIEVNDHSDGVALIRRDDFENHQDSIYDSRFEYSGQFEDCNRLFWDSLFLSAEVFDELECGGRCMCSCPTGEIIIIDANNDTTIVEYYDCADEVDRFESNGIIYCISFGSRFEMYKARIERTYRQLRENIAIHNR